MHLENTRAVITGGASGLGEATARYFASQGAQVTILDRDGDRAATVAKQIGAQFAATDVTDETSVASAVAFAKSEMGSITVCVNCAGIVIGAKTLGRNGPHPLPAFATTVDVNLTGSFNVARLCAEVMAQNRADADGQRGVIIHTASIAGYDGQKGQTAYAASKGGLIGITLPMARDLAGQGIRVMSIAPGIFLTPMMQSLPKDVQDSLAADVPNPRRLGDPREYARTAAFIVEMPYLNGEVLRLDGALRMT